MRLIPLSHTKSRLFVAACTCAFVACFLFDGSLAPILAADAPPAKSSASTSSLEDVLAKRKDIAGQVDALGAQSGEHAASADGVEVSTTEDELEFLQTLDGVYAQQQVRLEQQQELQAELKKSEADLEAFRKFGPTEAKPYSFLLLEDLRDELAAAEDHDDAFNADIKPAGQLLQAAQSHFDQAEKDRRRVQEELAENKNTEHTSMLTAALQLAQRESQIAKELIVVRRLEVDVRSLRRDVGAVRKTHLVEKIDSIGKNVRFTRQDVQDRLKDLTTSAADLEAKVKAAHAHFRQSESEQVTAVKLLHDQNAPQATIDLAGESWRVARDALQLELSLLNERLADNKRLHHYWECRFAVESSAAKPTEIEEWSESLGDMLDEISDNERSLEQRIETTRIEQAKLVERMRDNEDPAVKQWGDFQCAQWQRLREVCETHLVQLKVNKRWSGRFREELQAKLQPQHAQSWWTLADEQAISIWSYEVVTVNDLPITVGKIVSLVVYLVLSILSAKVLSRLLGRRLLPRLGLNEGASHAVQAIAFYSLAVLFGVLSFQVVHVPLAAFAFLGGAVAIAIGFGSQDIANNFMSGIIILAEQPIRVGDIVVVDGVQGTVNHIGPRSTRLKTDSNHELIVPNSKLLSDKVTNLTLSDSLIQTTVTVTLPLKMTVREAKQLLLSAALSQSMVLHKPIPIVLFKQFGASSMDFELHFWLQLEDEMQAAIAQSEVREAINDLFLQHDAQPAIDNVSSALPNRSKAA
jgi:small-conductance mechanosensitive channel